MAGNSDYDAVVSVGTGIRFPDDEAGRDGPTCGPERDAAADPAQADADVDDARAKFTLALSAGDKLTLKMAAAKLNVTVAKLVHQWIATLDGPGREPPEPVPLPAESVAEAAAHVAGEPVGPVDARRPPSTGRMAGRSLDGARAAFHGAFVTAARCLTVADLAGLGLRPDTAGMSPDEIEAFGRRTLFDIIGELM